jgi:hypothetical protein
MTPLKLKSKAWSGRNLKSVFWLVSTEGKGKVLHAQRMEHTWWTFQVVSRRTTSRCTAHTAAGGLSRVKLLDNRTDWGQGSNAAPNPGS